MFLTTVYRFPNAFASTKRRFFFRKLHNWNFIFSKKGFIPCNIRLLTYYTKTHEYIKWKSCDEGVVEGECVKEKNGGNLRGKVKTEGKYVHNENMKTQTKGKKCRVGISKYGTEKLGEVVYVDIMHKINDRVEKGECIATVESVKSVGDVYTPIGGVVTDVNNKIMDEVNLINRDSEEEGWIIEMEVDDINEKEVLSLSEYKKLCEEEDRQERLQTEQIEQTGNTDQVEMDALDMHKREQNGRKGNP